MSNINPVELILSTLLASTNDKDLQASVGAISIFYKMTQTASKLSFLANLNMDVAFDLSHQMMAVAPGVISIINNGIQYDNTNINALAEVKRVLSKMGIYAGISFTAYKALSPANIGTIANSIAETYGSFYFDCGRQKKTN